ncbi:MAG: xanthine dehydrogenase family protein molybdopterin-binding subunit [Dehalococcoidia bacterium]
MAAIHHSVGQPVGNAEGTNKVTGATKYTADIALPGTLIGKCLRSPYPYARIKSIDVAAARRLPGVHAVLTAEDIPNTLVGRSLRDLPVLARGVAIFAGQKVAAVAAEDEVIADEALNLIEVEYEELEPMLDPESAMQPGAPVIHPNYDNYVGNNPGPQDRPNLVGHGVFGKGDLEQGFAEADHIFEHTFKTVHQHQVFIEPHSVLAQVDEAGRFQVWSTAKAPFRMRREVAEGLDVPEDNLRVNPVALGGDFGGKGGFMDTPLACFLAQASGRPVQMIMTYIEELLAGNPRHPAVMTFKTGVKDDGTITARQASLVFECGASGGFRPSASVSFGSRCLGPYRIPHAQVETYMVYTNRVPAGNMRAPGDPQSVFGGEADLDLVARKLNMDPYEFRMKNLVVEGEESPLGVVWEDMKAHEVMRAAIEESGYQQPKPQVPGKKVGRGVAITERHVGAGISNAKVLVNTDGSVVLHTSMLDTGSGFYTIFRQIVGEELGVGYDEVDLVPWSTDDTTFDTGAGGSRVTHVGGQAVYGASREVRNQLVALAADLYGWPEDRITFSDHQVHAPGQTPVSLAELVSRAGQPVEGQFVYNAERNEEVTVFTAQVAEVEVDEETGEVKLTRFTSANDVGAVLNPLAHQGQIEGGVVQSIGFALMEELQYVDGHISTLSLGDYKVPTIKDIPEMRTVLVESEGGPGPYGGKAIGEQPVSTVAPAIVNAVLDAVGVSITDLPVTSEKVFRALRVRDEGR